METILQKSKIVSIIVSVAIKERSKFLLVQEAKKEVFGLWNFPTGKVEFGENLFEAAKREVLEETGFECKLTGVSGINFFYWKGMPGLTIRFNFTAERKSAIPKDLAKDVIKTQWFTLAEIGEMDNQNKLRSESTEKQYKELSQNIVYPLDLFTEFKK